MVDAVDGRSSSLVVEMSLATGRPSGAGRVGRADMEAFSWRGGIGVVASTFDVEVVVDALGGSRIGTTGTGGSTLL